VIKITAADKWFSLCVRERAEWRCERCGNMPDRRGLHCSHMHGRGKWSVRFHPANATALCMGCHLLFGGQPTQHHEWQLERLGRYTWAALGEAAQDLSRGRRAKREAKAIAAHYRAEYQRMAEMRAAGVAGRIQFVGWD